MGLSDEQIDQVMTEAGKDLESQKQASAKAAADLVALQQQLDAANAQLTEAGKTIEGFKAMNVDQIKASADEWKAKAEQATKDAAAQVESMRFEHALERAVSGFSVYDPADVLHRLDRNALKLKDDGSVVGLEDQMKSLQSSAAHLFKSTTPDPKIVAGATQPPDTKEPLSGFLAAVYKGAGLEPKKQ